MNSISANLNVMIKACEKASKILIRDFGELEKLQVSKKGPRDFVTNSDVKAEKIIIELIKNSSADAVYWNRCYEPWRMERDKLIKSELKLNDVDVRSFNATYPVPLTDRYSRIPRPVQLLFRRKICSNAQASP